MVLQKKLDYGFNGYQFPTMPRGSRSTRGKRPTRKKVEENQMCAFELLASVAGKLLLEKENSPMLSNTATGDLTPTIGKDMIKKEQQDEVKPSKVGLCDQGSCDEGTRASEIGFQRQAHKYTLKECSQASSAVSLGPASIVIKSDPSKKIASAEKSMVNRSTGEFGNFLGPALGRHSAGSAESYRGKLEDGIPHTLQVKRQRTKNGIHRNVADTCCLEDPMEVDTKPPSLVSSDSSVEVPLCGDHNPHSGSFPNCRNDIELPVDRDDDENSSGCTHPCTIASKAFRPQRIGDRRIRKLLASKFWKVGPTLLKDGEFSNTDEEVKPVFRSRKMCCTRQRTQRCSYKRRKLFERGSISTSDGAISSGGISCPPEKVIKGEASCSAASMHGGNGTSSSMTGQKSPFESEDYHVKLNIKSFKVPELFIEIPETATVGSLKRTVMEAVTAILGGGLRVGVLLQGKKVRDDNKTLIQSGISHDDKLDGLGFTLEPNPSQAPEQLTNTEVTQFLPPCDATEPLTRLPAIPALDPGVVPDEPPDPPLITSGNCESDHNSVPSPTDILLEEKTSPNSKALVAVPAMSVEALAVVPLHRKSRRSELVQRRIRRPFSVSEVEALVQAVEKLGTGRWRDVKLRAFDNAKHRTYVDLKDKWKTLVHTARISPQQRRGEPVPQDLLDRVLSAHAYWSHQQAKLQLKQQQQQSLLL